MEAKAPGRPHFAVMDGLRGVAACLVVLCHSWANGGPVQNGPLAVDFFFLLSGFVIAHAYEDRLAAGMTVREFVKRRLIRLYPLILLGAGGAFTMALTHCLLHPAGAPSPRAVAVSGALSLLLLPYLGPGLGVDTFSFNPPLWSLSFEVLANVAYALLVRRLSGPVLGLIVLAGLAATVAGGAPGGWSQANLLGGVPRVACGVFGGVLLHRLHRGGRLPRVSGRFSLLAAALVGAVCWPWVITGWMFVPAYVTFCLIIAGAAAARPQRVDGLCLWLGVISYPLYTLHWLTLFAFGWVAQHFGLLPAWHTPVALVHALCVPCIAYAAARWYDAPLRRYLTAWRRNGAINLSVLARPRA